MGDAYKLPNIYLPIEQLESRLTSDVNIWSIVVLTTRQEIYNAIYCKN